jgi:hypothetical protein
MGARSGLSSTPKACSCGEGNEQAVLSTPKACGVGVPSSPRHRRAGGLPITGDPFELAAYVLKILQADVHAEHLLNHGEEISQRTNRA